MTTARGRTALRVLATYETVFAASALAGGLGLITGAPGFRLPTGVLGPFGLSSWVLPGLALIVAIGGTLGWAAASAWRGSRQAPGFGYAAGVVLAGWLAVQLAVLGFHEPVQWVTLALLVVLVLLSRYVQRAVSRDPRRALGDLPGRHRRPARAGAAPSPLGSLVISRRRKDFRGLDGARQHRRN